MAPDRVFSQLLEAVDTRRIMGHMQCAHSLGHDGACHLRHLDCLQIYLESPKRPVNCIGQHPFAMWP